MTPEINLELKILNRIVEHAACGIVILSDDSVVYVNRTLCEQSGYSQDELSGDNFWNVFDRHILKILADNNLTIPELRTACDSHYKSKDGQTHWIEFSGDEFDDGGIGQTVLYIYDITYRRNVISELNKSENCFRQMAESVQDIFWISNRSDGQLIYISPAYETIFGRSREEMYLDSDSYLKYVHPKDKERVINRFREPDLETNEEYRMIRPDGTIRWLRSKSFPVRDINGKVYRTVGLSTDITEEKNLRGHLINSQAQLTQAIKSIDGGLWEINLSRYEEEKKLPDHIYISPELKALLGFEDHEFPNTIQAWNSRMYPDDLKRLDQITLHNLRRSIDNHETEYRIRHKDGSWRWMYTRSRLREDEDGGIYWTGIDFDITRKKEAEIALRESEEFLSHTIAVLKGGIWKLDMRDYQEGRSLPDELYISPGLKEIIGYQDDEFPNSTYAWRDIIVPEDLKCYIDASTRHLKGESDLFEIEYRIRHRNGNIIWLHTRGKIERDDTGRPLSWIGIDYDITPNKEAELALLSSEKFSRAMIGNSPIGISVRSPHGQLINCNRAWRKIWNKSRTEVESIMAEPKTELKFDRRDNYLGDSINQVERIYREGGYLHIPEMQVTRSSDGLKMWLSQRFYAIMAEDNKVERVVILTEDISERKKAELALTESKATLQSVFDSAPIGIGISCNRTISWTNEYMSQILGYTAEEFDGMDSRILYFNNKYYEELGGLIKDTILKYGSGSIESRLIGKDGRVIDVIIGGSVIDKNSEQPRLVFTVLDITERKRAERFVLLQRDLSQRLNVADDYVSAAKIMMEYCLQIDEIDCGSMYVVDESKEKLQLVHHEGLLAEFAEAVREYDLDSPTVKLITEGCPVYATYSDLKFADNPVGEKEGLEALAVLPILVEGNVMACINLGSHTTQNIPENACMAMEAIASTMGRVIARIRSRIAQQSSDSRFRAVFENAQDIIFIKDMELRYTDINPEIEKLLNIPSESIIGRTDSEVFGEEFDNFNLPHDLNVLRGDSVEVEMEGLKGIDDRVINIKKAPMRNAKGEITGICGIARDVTETRKLQEFSARAMRLETAGRIAGQVAHDFNNLLGPLVAYPDLIMDELGDHPEVHGYLEDMKRAAQQISDINQQLLTLGRRGHYNLAVTNVNDIIKQAVKRLYPVPATLILETNLAADLMNIKCGASQILRVLSNLVTNSRDAMDDIGRISIMTENFYVDRLAGKYGRVPAGEYVKVSICDNGVGIPNEILPKIFEPFYTTKKTSRQRGSGLGLSVVHAVMEDHDGYIDLESVEGEGTSVYLYFPITRQELEKDQTEEIVGGTESILIVDDDRVQRDVATKLLTRLGYTVNSAESGETALELVMTNKHDLIILDMVMPGGIDGTETYRRMLKINPHQRAVIVSGFAESSRVSEAIKLGAGRFIRKPLTLQSIADAVRLELDCNKIVS